MSEQTAPLRLKRSESAVEQRDVDEKPPFVFHELVVAFFRPRTPEGSRYALAFSLESEGGKAEEKKEDRLELRLERSGHEIREDRL